MHCLSLRRAHLALVVLLGATLASTAGCVDTGPPEWWDYEEGGTGTGLGLTAAREGQACTPEQLSPPLDSLRLHFIDVGQGDAIFIQTPTGQNVLVDAGDGGFFERTDAGPIVEGYLTARGLPPGSTLDAAVITHAHSDHYGGFDHLLERYTIERFVDPGLDSTSTSYSKVINAARARVEPSDFHRPAVSAPDGLVSMFGQSVDLFGPEVAAWLLSASASTRLGSSDNARINNTSIVLRLSYGGRHVLLTGDIHQEIEAEIQQRFLLSDSEPRLDTHLLKVAHHGSDSSSTILEGLFRNIPPEERYAVIQAGRMNFGHEDAQLPSEDTIFRLWSYMAKDHLFSTEAGDAGKDEAEAVGDDHVLAVLQADGAMYVCYTGP